MIDDCKRVSEELLDADGDLTIYDGEPFTGTGFDKFPNGCGVEYETTYKDGLPHGLKRKWYEMGRLEYEISCFNGVKHGEETHWFINGIVKSKATYEYGIRIESRSWDEQGNLIAEFNISPNSTNFALLRDRRQKGWR